MVKHGNLKNTISMSIFMNKNMQNLLGFEDSEYKIFFIDPGKKDGKGKLIIGNTIIKLGISHPNYIMVYSDIIEPSRFGQQFINLLDILPFDQNNFSLDRKLNNLCYKNVNKNIINDISIIIQDPSFNIMENFSQDCIVTIHFREKKQYINTN